MSSPVIALQLWIGVIFLLSGGILSLFQLRLYVTGRYFVETHSEGVEKGFWTSLRWLWATFYLACTILFFFLALWLIRYILTQPLDA